MAQPHFSDQELKALYAGIDTAAKSWQQQKTFIDDSQMREDFFDPGVFQAEADTIFGQRARPVAMQASGQMEGIRAQGHLSGLRGGVTDRRLSQVAGSQATAVAAIRGEVDLGAEQKRSINEQNYMNAMQQLMALEGNVVTGQQMLARRLGEQAQYDKQYKEDRFYEPRGEAATEFFDYMGFE